MAYKNGNLWARRTIKTAGAAVGIETDADRSQIKADGLDLSFVTVRVVDANGETVPRAKDALTCTITGPGEMQSTAQSGSLGSAAVTPQSTP